MVDKAVAQLRSSATIRDRCHNILQAVEAGRSAHFTLQLQRLEAVARQVEAVTRQHYPDLNIPYHSRWRHFEAGAVDRKAQLDAGIAHLDSDAQARARIDLTIISVLLDAGAGAQWAYYETDSDQTFVRSEGLGVASFHAFMQGKFSSCSEDPYRVDAIALQKINLSDLMDMFQVSESNPLTGLDGRLQLLQRLGQCLAANPEVFGAEARPGLLFDSVTAHGHLHILPAASVLSGLLNHFSPIWLTGSTLNGAPLGDCWRHPLAGGEGDSSGWVPFHKLSQWLTYSLLEPFQWAGIEMTDLDGLTGLPEYRNGGLLLDMGVIIPQQKDFYTRSFTAADEAIIEWRALTIALLDKLAPLVRDCLGKTAHEMPLACILEGGTWAAGRAVARQLREGGVPPINIVSDGTVF